MTEQQIAAVKQALEALNYLQGIVDTDRGPKAAEALRRALADQALDKKAENARELGLDYDAGWKDGYKHGAWASEQQPAEKPVGGCTFTAEQRENPDVQIEEPECVKSFPDDVVWKKPLYTRPQPAAQFAGSYGTIDESAAKRIAIALGWEPKREWVALTQQDIDIAFDDTQEGGGFNEFARAIEQRLKEKNT